MYPFKYHRPTNLADAAARFAAGDDASYISGGHTLLPTLKARLAAPSDMIDLTALPELKGIEETEDGRIEIVRVAPSAVRAANPAFDVTPARLVTGIVTERGVAEASESGLASLFPEHARDQAA